jgi:hypothetical protein
MPSDGKWFGHDSESQRMSGTGQHLAARQQPIGAEKPGAVGLLFLLAVALVFWAGIIIVSREL